MPPTAVACELDSWQLPYSSCWQKTHFPQAMLNGTRTWSPTFSFRTSGPTCSTMPANSRPHALPRRAHGAPAFPLPPPRPALLDDAGELVADRHPHARVGHRAVVQVEVRATDA